MILSRRGFSLLFPPKRNLSDGGSGESEMVTDRPTDQPTNQPTDHTVEYRVACTRLKTISNAKQCAKNQMFSK